MWKNIYSWAGHRWQCGTCTLHAECLRLHTNKHTYTHTHTHTHTQRIRNISCFSTATMVAQTHLNGTLYIHFLSCRTNYGILFFFLNHVWTQKWPMLQTPLLCKQYDNSLHHEQWRQHQEKDQPPYKEVYKDKQ